MIPAIIPCWQVLDAKSDILDVLGRELVPVQRIYCQNIQAGLQRVCGVKAGLLNGRQDLLVGLRDLVPSLGGIDVHPEA